MMTREEILEQAEAWLLSAEGRPTEDMEKRFLALADAWLRLAAEVRKGYSAPTSLDVN